MKYIDIKNSMDSYFYDEGHNCLNTTYLMDCIYITIENTRYLIEDVINSRRRKIHSIVWEGFVEVARSNCYYISHPAYGENKKDYCPTNAQLKKYIAEYGYTVEELFKDIVAQLEHHREESYRPPLTPSQLKAKYIEHNPDGHFFDKETLKHWGNRMKDMTVNPIITPIKDCDSELHYVYVLYINSPTEQHDVKTYYFDSETFKLVYPREW